MKGHEQLASYRRCAERIACSWAGFQSKRVQRLREQERFGHAAERATEAIVEDLFTEVLDWPYADINHQVGHSDILLTRLGIKHLIVETKAPRSLAWQRRAVDRALEQARRYAAEQKVRRVAVSDGVMLYAADMHSGGLRDRVFCSLESTSEPLDLWWMSVDGIYRERTETGAAALRLLPEALAAEPDGKLSPAGGLLHPKYKLPARCFAYVGDPEDPRSWHLPYLNSDGSVDVRRLPKAVQAIVSNYRGARLMKVPESAIPDVLVRLGQAAGSLGKLPDQAAEPAPAYRALAAALEQLGRLEAVRESWS